MAKYECIIPAWYDFDETIQYFHNHLTGSSISASFEEGSDYRSEKMRVVVRVYERYTVLGGNRLSMTVMLVTSGEEIFASAITAAGGRGMMKLVAWGEEDYLEDFVQAAKMFEGMRPVGTAATFD